MSDDEMKEKVSDKNDPIKLKEKRERFKYELRDNIQAWWEGKFIMIVETLGLTGGAALLYYVLDVPFEIIVFFLLALISATVSSIWRCYVR